MLKCPGCSAPLDESDHTCSACGIPLEGTAAPTVIEGLGSSPRSSHATVEIPAPTFYPGDLLAGRYRLVSFLGRGGMGEIYQVEDLKLGQTVALKFLPEALTRNGAALARFHREVRLARQISHPNVCRVFDVGEARGRPFLCMEYIRGANLRTLLSRRNDKLPREKALDIAWQLCAGLAAIHDAGILHRDLKPSNVMIDERGRARITDFGVAALAEESHQERSGTPAYMAPEQAADGEGSVRSDLYSLGLVLYEIFAGRTPERHKPVAPSRLVVDLDPAAERMILRCLEQDPRDRPSSAVEVARALSGDPLSAALLGGETPSPEMVASAPGKGDLTPAKGAACFAAVLAILCALLALCDRFMAHHRVPLPHSPEVLAGRARGLLAQLGYAEAPRYAAYGFELDSPELGSSAEEHPLYWFWYQESPRRMRWAPLWIIPDDPPRSIPGDANLVLSPAGRLERMDVLPKPATAGRPPPGWNPLLRAAGFDPARIAVVKPLLLPVTYADRRAAWEAKPLGHATPVRIEAASYQGRPVSLRIVGASTPPPVQVTTPWTYIPSFVAMFGLAVILLMARRSLRSGIGDLTGAWRLASFVFVLSMVSWFAAGMRMPTWRNLTLLAGDPALAWCSYLSFEPLARRRWPSRIVSWTRLLAGHVRDPMVGRDVLLGCLLGLGFALVSALEPLTAASVGGQPRFRLVSPESLTGFAGVVRQLCSDLASALGASLAFVITLVALQQILGRERRALFTFAALYMALLLSVNRDNLWLALAFSGLKVAIALVIWVRFGLLADLASRVAYTLVLTYPLTHDPSDWYAGTTLFVSLAVTGMAVYGFAVSTAPSIRSR
jgi:predicted Ser/Thr protein kinase